MIVISLMSIIIGLLKGSSSFRINKLILLLIFYVIFRSVEAIFDAGIGYNALKYFKSLIYIFPVIVFYSDGIRNLEAFTKVLIFYARFIVIIATIGHLFGYTQYKYIAATNYYKEYSVLMSVRIEIVLLMLWHAMRLPKTRSLHDFVLLLLFIILPHLAAGELERWIGVTQIFMLMLILKGWLRRIAIIFGVLTPFILQVTVSESFSTGALAADQSLLARLHEFELARELILENIWCGTGVNILSLDQGRFFAADLGYVGMLLMHGVIGSLFLLYNQWYLFKVMKAESLESFESIWWFYTYIFFVMLSISKLNFILNFGLFIAIAFILYGIIINGNKYHSLRL